MEIKFKIPKDLLFDVSYSELEKLINQIFIKNFHKAIEQADKEAEDLIMYGDPTIGEPDGAIVYGNPATIQNKEEKL